LQWRFPSDRPLSFIVTFTLNPVLERLYQEVGIEIICLDPEGKTTSQEEKTDLLSQFMLELSSLACLDSNIPGQSGIRQFYSRAITRHVNQKLQEAESNLASQTRGRRRWASPVDEIEFDRLLMSAARRSIPNSLKADVLNIIERLATINFVKPSSTMLAINYAKTFGSDDKISYIIARAISLENPRLALMERPVPWNILWGSRLTRSQAEHIIKRSETELKSHREDEVRDHDLAFLADVVHRIISGEIFDISQTEVVDMATRFVSEASNIYPSIGSYVPPKGDAPKVDAIISEIDELEEEEPTEEDVPF